MFDGIKDLSNLSEEELDEVCFEWRFPSTIQASIDREGSIKPDEEMTDEEIDEYNEFVREFLRQKLESGHPEETPVEALLIKKPHRIGEIAKTFSEIREEDK